MNVENEARIIEGAKLAMRNSQYPFFCISVLWARLLCVKVQVKVPDVSGEHRGIYASWRRKLDAIDQCPNIWPPGIRDKV